ncbi:MAG TPA: biotin carboxylase N-terminal domain-containing protein [Xanthobacteraceae bacterium]|jgi:3-methylcrotonyl-CoA carboxylase alpha subunit
MFSTILIANRGEIACRIIRTARRFGIRTVAVYSEPDAQAMHVAAADEAYLIGPGPARESYLSIECILDAARKSGAQAIHPGYGFLSENADFAEACAAAGIVFIGPSAASIRAIGDKAHAKTIMERAGIATVPGYHGEAQEADRFAAQADRLGYPVLIKAVAGGGGRGMRVVAEPTALAAALESARNEALSAFGNGRLIVEKYLPSPRHVEVQVFGDQHGHMVHLFERDCSAQRRHQKVIEEQPAPQLDEALRRALGTTAVAAARAADYVGAGTVEFILHDKQFYFIEMNTRLQVEHPVTEMVTRYDLVEWQLRVAAGEALPARQEQICSRGHAMEARLYAEDPAHDFVPASGRLRQFRLPAATLDLRVETGMREGDEIPIFYDALLAKLIVWGSDREDARRGLETALAATQIGGVAHNRDFLVRLVRHRDFVAGAIDTGFIERHRSALTVPLSAAPLPAVAAAALALLYPEPSEGPAPAWGARDSRSPWSRHDGWRLAGDTDYELIWLEAGLERRLNIVFERAGLTLTMDEITAQVRRIVRHGTEIDLELDSVPMRASVQQRGADFEVALKGQSWQLRHLDPLSRRAGADAGPARLIAPVHGRVLDVQVSAGAKVKRGQVLMLLECMKLEYRVTAPADGVVEALHFATGDVVEDGVQLLDFTPAGP